MFEQLITVKGVVPKLGITILSGIPINELMSAIINGQAGLLSKIPYWKKQQSELFSNYVEGGRDAGLGRRNNKGGGESLITLLWKLQALFVGFRGKDAEEVVAKIQKKGRLRFPLIKQSLRVLKS